MEVFAERCPWYIAGPAIGLLVVGLLAVANKPLGASGGWIDLVAFLRRPSSGVKWTMFFVAGIVLGGALSAIAAGGWSSTLAYGAYDARFGTSFETRAALLALAGVIMGYGVRTAGGCTSGHGICGTSLGSRASWVSTIVFMGVAVLVTNLLVRVLGVGG